MRGDRRRIWVASISRVGFQAAGAQFPTIDLVITKGPEEGRQIVVGIDVEELLAKLQAMADAQASESTTTAAPAASPPLASS